MSLRWDPYTFPGNYLVYQTNELEKKEQGKDGGERKKRGLGERDTMEESREAEEGGVGTFKGRVGGQEMEMAGAHHKFFFAPSWLEILLHVLLYFQCCLRLLHTAVTAPLACFTPAVVKHNSTPCLYLSSIICIIE